MDSFARDRVYAQLQQISPVFYIVKISFSDYEHHTQFQVRAVMLFQPAMRLRGGVFSQFTLIITLYPGN